MKGSCTTKSLTDILQASDFVKNRFTDLA
jgi:hypothetical protein